MEEQRIAVGFKGGALMVGMSPRFLELAARDPDRTRRLKTVRIAKRRLIRVEDLRDWFNRVAREESEAA